jgi:hypothetical protein
MALCVTPAKAAQTAATPPKATCHHCHDQAPEKPIPDPTAPCKHCPTTSQDRLATESDRTILKTAVELTPLPQLDPAPVAPTLYRSFEITLPSVHSPPNERLHQFCLLLI